MKRIFILLALVAFTACGKENKFPSEFSGQWFTEIEGVEHRIKVTENGVWTFDGMPAQVKLRLRLIEETKEGFILETTNTLNPTPKQYTLNRIEEGIWIVTMLNEDLSVMEGIPDDKWKALN